MFVSLYLQLPGPSDDVSFSKETYDLHSIRYITQLQLDKTNYFDHEAPHWTWHIRK